MRRLLIAAAALSTAACTHVGTKTTIRAERGNAVRAVDQQLLSEAVDAAFAALEIPKVRRPDGTPAPKGVVAPAGLVSAYVLVSTVMPLDEELRDYVTARASAAAAGAGLNVREVRRVLERQGGSLERTYLEYPDTDARVLVMVSYAGIDQIDAYGQPRSTDSQRSARSRAGSRRRCRSCRATATSRPGRARSPARRSFSMDEVRYWYAR